MPEPQATPAVAACSPAAMANTGMVVLLAMFDPLVVNIAVALAPSGQSNDVSCYPYEEIRCYGRHYCFRVVGSNSYYSYIILIEILYFEPNNCTFIRLPLKNDFAPWIQSKGSM